MRPHSIALPALVCVALVGLACAQPGVAPTVPPDGGRPAATTIDAAAPLVLPPPVIPNQPPPPAATGDAGPFLGGVLRPCAGLECRQTSCRMGTCEAQACAGETRTTLRGKVYDPAGRIPLYNVIVYVPNAELAPIATGPGCNRCDSPISGKPIAAALTDTSGEFVLENVPVGDGVPLVLQVGKWRRAITLPNVRPCTENRVDDPNLLRLPRTQSEGNIPRIALATGSADPLECLLRKLGIADSEFTPEGGAGRINLYAGRKGAAAYAPTLNGGAAYTPAMTFWENPANVAKYDVVMFACEGGGYGQDKSAAARQALVDYANAGGRVFTTHYQGVWIKEGPAPWPTVGSFSGHPDLASPITATVDTSFPKGEALADWLVKVGASTSKGSLPLFAGQHTATAVNPTTTRAWITVPAVTPASVQYFSFNTPVAAEAGKECGRVVFTDIHISSGDAVRPFPTGCSDKELSAQEKALAFMLFDLSSCVQADDLPPRPPLIE